MFFNFTKDMYPVLIVIECHWRILRQTASIFSVSLQIITRFKFHCHVKNDKLRIPSDDPVILCNCCISGHSTTIFASLVIFQQCDFLCPLRISPVPKAQRAQADPFLVLFHQSVLWVWIPENLAAKRSLNKVEDSISLLCYDSLWHPVMMLLYKYQYLIEIQDKIQDTSILKNIYWVPG